MTATEAARQLGISRSLLYSLCGQRAIRHRRFGTGRGVLSFEQTDLDEYRARTEVAPADEIQAALDAIRKSKSRPTIPDYVPRKPVQAPKQKKA